MAEGVPTQRTRMTPLRGALAVLVVFAFLSLGLAYHDGLLGVGDLADSTEPGVIYRFRGTVTLADDDGFVLQDGSASLSVAWNATRPIEGRTYVVSGFYNETLGALEAGSVIRPLLFQ